MSRPASYFRVYRRLRTAGVTRSSILLYPLRRRIGSRQNRLAFGTGERLVSPPDEPLLTLVDESWVDQRYRPEGWQLRPGGLVIDIGANVGVFTVWASRRAGAGAVIAFEPTHSSAKVLQANVEANGLEGVVVRTEAVGGAPGRAPLYRRGQDVMNTLYGTDLLGSRFTQVDQVDVVTLDQVFAALGGERCDLLKLDCEGAEYEILGAASPETLGRIDAVAAEYHVGLNAGTPSELAAILTGAGMEVTVHPLMDVEGGHLHAVRRR